MNADQHCATKVSIALGDLNAVWANASDRVRIEIVKSVIWTAPDNHAFHAKLVKILTAPKFQQTLD